MFSCRATIVFDTNSRVVFFSLKKGENWFAARTNVAILKTQNYRREMITRDRYFTSENILCIFSIFLQHQNSLQLEGTSIV